jgi:hypothetical protein
LLVVAVLVSGCAGPSQTLSDSDRKAFRTVNISPDVKKPPAPYYVGPGGAAGMLGGAIGAAATQGVRDEQLKNFQGWIQSNGVVIEKIVLEEIDKAVRASGKLTVSGTPGPAAATMRISIEQYGFSVSNALSSTVVPILYIRCEMVEPGGRTIWSAGDRTLTLGNPGEAVTPVQLRNNPKAMESSWRSAAKAIAANIVKEF